MFISFILKPICYCFEVPQKSIRSWSAIMSDTCDMDSLESVQEWIKMSVNGSKWKNLKYKAEVSNCSLDQSSASDSSSVKEDDLDPQLDSLKVLSLKDKDDAQPNHRHRAKQNQDKNKPFYVPRKPHFFEHDLRAIDEEDFKEVKKINKKSYEDFNKWSHDMFDSDLQKPKSRRELIDSYGYDIRSDNPDEFQKNFRGRQHKSTQKHSNRKCYDSYKSYESESCQHRGKKFYYKEEEDNNNDLFESCDHNKYIKSQHRPNSRQINCNTTSEEYQDRNRLKQEGYNLEKDSINSVTDPNEKGNDRLFKSSISQRFNHNTSYSSLQHSLENKVHIQRLTQVKSQSYAERLKGTNIAVKSTGSPHLSSDSLKKDSTDTYSSLVQNPKSIISENPSNAVSAKFIRNIGQTVITPVQKVALSSVKKTANVISTGNSKATDCSRGGKHPVNSKLIKEVQERTISYASQQDEDRFFNKIINNSRNVENESKNFPRTTNSSRKVQEYISAPSNCLDMNTVAPLNTDQNIHHVRINNKCDKRNSPVDEETESCIGVNGIPGYSYYGDNSYRVENGDHFIFPDPPDLSSAHLMPCIPQHHFYYPNPHQYYQQGYESPMQWGFYTHASSFQGSQAGITILNQQCISNWLNIPQIDQFKQESNPYCIVRDEVELVKKEEECVSCCVNDTQEPTSTIPSTKHRYSLFRSQLYSSLARVSK